MVIALSQMAQIFVGSRLVFLEHLRIANFHSLSSGLKTTTHQQMERQLQLLLKLKSPVMKQPLLTTSDQILQKHLAITSKLSGYHLQITMEKTG